MRWSDERYVRVYVRDTVDWLALSFDAQALLLLILRKLDRAGVLDLGKQGKRGVSAAIGHAHLWERLEPALDELLRDGCVELTDGRLIMRNFIEAQETRQSDAARKRDQRERDRDLARGQVTKRDSECQNSHTESRAVTPIRTVPSRTKTVLKTRGQAALAGFELPPGVEPALWRDWLVARLKARAAKGERAERLSLDKLVELVNQGQDGNAVLRQAIERNYRGLAPVNSFANGARPAQPDPGPHYRPAGPDDE